MPSLTAALQACLPRVTLQAGDGFYWSPESQTIVYNHAALANNTGVWSLLHEAGHARLGHQSYQSDIELLLLEVAAWQAAKDLANALKITIDEDHIQDCLDTYRDWLHQRSTCPRCSCVSLQASPKQYRCHNCNSSWFVTAARFRRPYRLTAKESLKRSSLPAPTFT